jgi:hypothetical protein
MQASNAIHMFSPTSWGGCRGMKEKKCDEKKVDYD